MKTKTLTFDNDTDPLFTLAYDEQGRCYRVLYAAGGRSGDTYHYHLAAHSPEGKATAHRGLWIKASDPRFAAIREADRVGTEKRQAKLAATYRSRALTANEI